MRRIRFSTSGEPPRSAQIDFGIRMSLDIPTGQLYALFNKVRPEGCASITHVTEVVAKPGVYEIQATLEGDFSLTVEHFILMVMTTLGWNLETTEALDDNEQRWSLGTAARPGWILIQPE